MTSMAQAGTALRARQGQAGICRSTSCSMCLNRRTDFGATPHGRHDLSFSIKDTTDPCRYAVFSDQSGDVYEATPSQQKGRLRLLSEK